MDFLKNFKIHHWPYVLCIWSAITLTTTYSISVLNGHVYKYFPFISDTGTLPPESCIFSQMIDIGTIWLAITFYIRYRQLDFDITTGNIDLDRKWNTRGAWMAPFVCLGFSMVGNFQVTNLISVHLIGALLLFGFGIAYCFVQTKISFAKKRNPRDASCKYNVSRKIQVIRVLLSLTYVPFFLNIFIFGYLGGTEFTGETILYWTEEDGGYTYRLVSVLSEWALYILLCVYTLTFIGEFKSVKFEEIRFSTLRKSNNIKSKRSKIH